MWVIDKISTTKILVKIDSPFFSPSCVTFNLLSEHVPHCLDLTFIGQRFESAIFWKFMIEYLANDDRDNRRYIWALEYNTYIWPWLIVSQGHAYFNSEYILEMVTDSIIIAIKIGYLILAFNWHIDVWPWLILKVKVKVVYIPNTNILEIVKDKATFTIAIKYEIIYGPLIGISGINSWKHFFLIRIIPVWNSLPNHQIISP